MQFPNFILKVAYALERVVLLQQEQQKEQQRINRSSRSSMMD
jgi:hypothetical protein